MTDQVVYHGTSDMNWNKADVGTLYLTTSREDAELYAEEAVDGNIPDIDSWKEDDPMPSQAIIVEFNMADLLNLHDVEFQPDWGWQEAEGKTWQQSIEAVGGFCIDGFAAEHKSLGRIVPAFAAVD